MNAAQSLILALYAGLAGVILLSGYMYKLVRDRRKQTNTPKLNFPAQSKGIREGVQDDRFAPTP